MVLLLVFFLSLCPLLGQCCTCRPFYNRTETLELPFRFGYDVYSGVVVGAVCPCISGDDTVDCRGYSYNATSGSYAAIITDRVRVNFDDFFNYFLTTCEQAENSLGLDDGIQKGREPEEVVNSTSLLACQFDNEFGGELCMYSIRVTEVFSGDFAEGDVISSSGPDSLTTCVTEYGRILQLDTDYLAGVGDPCSLAFNDWEPLSKFTREDLNYLRRLAGKPVDKGTDEPTVDNTATLHFSTAMIAVSVVAGSMMMI
jgi:hypothetical protein